MVKEKKEELAITDIEVVEEVSTDLAEQAESGTAIMAILNAAADDQYEAGLVTFKIVKETAEFTTPSTNETFSTIAGVILSVEIARSLWSDGTQEEQDQMDAWTGSRPICSSRNNNGASGALIKPVDGDTPQVLKDMVRPVIDNEFSCISCPYNQFGSKGDGKMCKEMRRLLIWIPASQVTGVLSLPPSSIRNWKEYRASLPNKHFSNVVTEITLESISKGKKIQYSVAMFTPKAEVNMVELASLAKPVTYQGQKVKEITAIMAEFLNLEMKKDIDYDTDGTTVADSGDDTF